MPWESAAPFVLITGGIWVMSELLDKSHKVAHGRPKTTGLDPWDRGLAERDSRFAKSWGKWVKDHEVSPAFPGPGRRRRGRGRHSGRHFPDSPA